MYSSVENLCSLTALTSLLGKSNEGRNLVISRKINQKGARKFYHDRDLSGFYECIRDAVLYGILLPFHEVLLPTTPIKLFFDLDIVKPQYSPKQYRNYFCSVLRSFSVSQKHIFPQPMESKDLIFLESHVQLKPSNQFEKISFHIIHSREQYFPTMESLKGWVTAFDNYILDSGNTNDRPLREKLWLPNGKVLRHASVW